MRTNEFLYQTGGQLDCWGAEWQWSDWELGPVCGGSHQHQSVFGLPINMVEIIIMGKNWGKIMQSIWNCFLWRSDQDFEMSLSLPHLRQLLGGLLSCAAISPSEAAVSSTDFLCPNPPEFLWGHYGRPNLSPDLFFDLKTFCLHFLHLILVLASEDYLIGWWVSNG